ncbi:MAG: hypothetical protein ABI867_07305 [Kofleriaceae bacterium]
MTRLAPIILLGLAGTALAQPAKTPTPPAGPVGLPAVGETLAPNGGIGWPTLEWMYGEPSMKDAAGKIVIHWFCAPKVAACVDDLARIITLKENSTRMFVIAYINGTKVDAKKLDPIRGSEGVGRGTVALGKNVNAVFKRLGVTGPASIIVDVDGKVALVTTGSTPAELDARDQKAKALATAIKEYVIVTDGPKTVQANTKFNLTITIKLASWLIYSKKPGTKTDYTVTVAKDIKCDNTVLKGDQLKPTNQTLTATVSCSGPKGSYEARGVINFGYDTPGGATGMGTDGATWKFEIK